MKRINIDVLQKGDVVLTSSTAKVSGLIRTFTGSDVSHAMICVGEASVMDSTGEGVQAWNIQRLFYDDESPIYIMRSHTFISPDKIDEIVKYVRASTGTSYTKREAAATVAPRFSEKGGAKLFCSRLVARAYASVGIMLVNNPDFCTPNELKKSELLTQVATPWVSVTDEELAEVRAVGDSTEGMREVTNNLLGKARKLDPNIESFNDLDRLLIQRPELDGAIADAYRSSGYLDHWNEEVARFPWWFDPVLMVQFYHSLSDTTELLDYCHQMLRKKSDGCFSHWETNAQGYSELNKVYPCETFRLLSELYLTLSSCQHLRIVSAEVLLNAYGNKASS